jgi:single-strand DNA-binding protein
VSTYNRATVIGHLGQDPEIRYSPGGVVFATMSVATSEQWKDKETGDKKERTDWIRVKASGRLAEVCGEYLKKGSQALFSGPIRVDKYKDKEGVDRFDTYVRADEMKMLGKREGDGEQRSSRGGGPVQRRGEQPPAGRGLPPPQDASYEDDDIPFISNRGTW